MKIVYFLSMALTALTLFGGEVQAKCVTEDPFPYTAPYEMDACPDDIQSWMNRVNTCAHFAGEEAYDAERKKFIDDAVAENKCSAIGCDFQTLFSQYEGDIVYIGIITEYAALVYGGDYVLECKTGEKK